MDGLWIFTLPRDVCVTDLSGRAGGRVSVRGPVRATRERLDTFDWRLLDDGIVLEYETAAGSEPRLRLLDPSAAPVVLEVHAPQRPDFARALPSAMLRRRLEPVLQMRALLARNQARGSLHELRVRDRRDKAVARVVVWRPSRRGDCVVRVHSVRGYENRARRVARRLGAMGATRALDADPLWLTADGGLVVVGGYPRFDVAGLSASMRTDDALQAALRHYRMVMDLNLPGVLADLDSEFLHDFRVGLRRSRTLVRRFDGVFPERALARFRGDLAWLSRVTGPARDAHVHCLVFEDYAAALGAEFADALGPLFAHVREAERDAHAALAAALDTPRFRRRWCAWQAFLQRPMPRASRQPDGPRPLLHTGTAAVERGIRRLLRQGRAITAASAPGDYHALRKSGKSLRYLLDVVGEFLEPRTTTRLLAQLKKMQDLLGEHQDLDVHREALLGIHARMTAQGVMDGETHAAMERLVRELAQRAAAARERFPRRFARFVAACPRRVRPGDGR